MMRGHPEELHRGPMPEQEARDWVATWRSDGGHPYAFVVVCRSVDPWRALAVERPCDCGKQIYDDPTMSHCCFHHEDEVVGPHSIMCGECFHVYGDEAEMKRIEMQRWPDSDPDREVLSCPYCIHDL